MIHMYGIHRMREKTVMRYSSAVLGSLPSRFAADLSVVSRDVYALDDICNPANLVVPGDGQLLHTGWLYPHLAANRRGCPGNKLSHRTARCNLT